MKITNLALTLLLATPGISHACSFPEPPSFTESVESADKIFILRVLEERVTDDGGFARGPIRGRIEIVETLFGEPAKFEFISFPYGSCGGVRLDVGHYYAAFTSQSGQTLHLAPADNSVIYLNGYIAGADFQNYNYPFLKSVRAYTDKAIPASAIDPFPNIERNGTVKLIDCDLCGQPSK